VAELFFRIFGFLRVSPRVKSTYMSAKRTAYNLINQTFCMYTVFVARTTGGMVVQKDFEWMEQARDYFNHLLAEKPYEGVMVMLLRKEGSFRSSLVDANVISSSVKPKADVTNGAESEAGFRN
jgi:hypothetical protein